MCANIIWTGNVLEELEVYLAASGGQSGWWDGWAARNAGWLSNSLSMRKIIGYGLKSTWNLLALKTCGETIHTIFIILNWHCCEFELNYLRNKTCIRKRYIISDTKFACTGRQKFLDGPESSGYPMLSPLFLLLFAHMNEHDEILQWLDARCYYFANFTNFGTLVHILWQKRTLRASLLQVMHNGHRLNQSVTICNGMYIDN